MRTSEWIQAGFTAILAVAAWIWPLSAKRRWAVTLIGAGTVCVVLLGRFSAYVFGPGASTALRDWLPVAVTLAPYWQTGRFFVGPNERVQQRLCAIDEKLLRFVPRPGFTWNRAMRQVMEWAYMMCYPLVPLGLGVLYAAGLGRDASTFWFLVLVPTYFCYAVTPLFPALPPRSLGKQAESSSPNRLRIMNLWILKRGSIQGVSFPSAHVASSLAVSLVLLWAVPAAGAVFLVVTFWIAVAAVAGGYHYAIDVLLGAVVALLVFGAWALHVIPAWTITALVRP